MAEMNFIGSNAVDINISMLPLYPAGKVEHFADGTDVWTGSAKETADMVKTPDGYVYAYGKNAVLERTLTIAPNSPLAVWLDNALEAQEAHMLIAGEPFQVTVVVTHHHSGQVDTYANGIISSGEQGMKVGSERLDNKQYTFKFANLITTGALV